METHQSASLAAWERMSVWVERSPNALLPTLASARWEIKIHREYYVRAGAVILGKGRAETLVHTERFPLAVLERRKCEALGSSH